MTQRRLIGQKCIPRRCSFGYSPIATTQTNTLVWVLTPREGPNEGFNVDSWGASRPARGGKASKRYLSHVEVRDLADAVDSLGKGIFRGETNGYGLLVRVLAYCGSVRRRPERGLHFARGPMYT